MGPIPLPPPRFATECTPPNAHPSLHGTSLILRKRHFFFTCSWCCLFQVVRSSGALEYKDKLIAAIKSTIHLKCKEAATLGATVSVVYSRVFKFESIFPFV